MPLFFLLLSDQYIPLSLIDTLGYVFTFYFLNYYYVNFIDYDD